MSSPIPQTGRPLAGTVKLFRVFLLLPVVLGLGTSVKTIIGLG